MPTAFRLSAPLAALLLASSPALAAEPAAKPACAPSVSLALNAWDTSVATAETFGSKAATIAREKGRDLLLPLLGIDPKTLPETTRSEDATGEIAREMEASRTDPARREALCTALSEAAAIAQEKAGAGLDALKGVMERFRPAEPRPGPVEPASGKDGLIKI